jgi:hypothetical protein
VMPLMHRPGTMAPAHARSATSCSPSYPVRVYTNQLTHIVINFCNFSIYPGENSQLTNDLQTVWGSIVSLDICGTVRSNHPPTPSIVIPGRYLMRMCAFRSRAQWVVLVPAPHGHNLHPRALEHSCTFRCAFCVEKNGLPVLVI